MIELVAPLFACPDCRGSLVRHDDANFHCVVCAAGFEVREGIPILLPRDEGPNTELGRRQAEYFDVEPETEFEITRPHGTPRLYRWQYDWRYARAFSRLEGRLPRAIALTVCGGSGMDAEFLARRGSIVVSSDVSFGAATRARERAHRFELPIFPIVADAERLPFRDGAIDVVAVHDGLHHLGDPHEALREMARVARVAVSVSEPSQAAITNFAVRLSLAEAVEEAGNNVARLAEADVIAVLSECGLQVLHSERLALYFRHRPGGFSRLLSTRGAFPWVRRFILLANRVIGRYGNKLVVQAIRPGG